MRLSRPLKPPAQAGRRFRRSRDANTLRFLAAASRFALYSLLINCSAFMSVSGMFFQLSLLLVLPACSAWLINIFLPSHLYGRGAGGLSSPIPVLLHQSEWDKDPTFDRRRYPKRINKIRAGEAPACL